MQLISIFSLPGRDGPNERMLLDSIMGKGFRQILGIKRIFLQFWHLWVTGLILTCNAGLLPPNRTTPVTSLWSSEYSWLIYCHVNKSQRSSPYRLDDSGRFTAIVCRFRSRVHPQKKRSKWLCTVICRRVPDTLSTELQGGQKSKVTLFTPPPKARTLMSWLDDLRGQTGSQVLKSKSGLSESLKSTGHEFKKKKKDCLRETETATYLNTLKSFFIVCHVNVQSVLCTRGWQRTYTVKVSLWEVYREKALVGGLEKAPILQHMMHL